MALGDPISISISNGPFRSGLHKATWQRLLAFNNTYTFSGATYTAVLAVDRPYFRTGTAKVAQATNEMKLRADYQTDPGGEHEVGSRCGRCSRERNRQRKRAVWRTIAYDNGHASDGPIATKCKHPASCLMSIRPRLSPQYWLLHLFRRLHRLRRLLFADP